MCAICHHYNVGGGGGLGMAGEIIAETETVLGGGGGIAIKCILFHRLKC